jgi:hypothetical protein
MATATEIQTPSHTPGPWKIAYAKNEWFADNSGENSTAEICAPRRRDPVCIVVEGAAYGRDATLGANAHLISAAPDMLDALRAFVNCDAFVPNLSPKAKPDDASIESERRETIYRMAERAIAKAEGRNQ